MTPQPWLFPGGGPLPSRPSRRPGSLLGVAGRRAGSPHFQRRAIQGASSEARPLHLWSFRGGNSCMQWLQRSFALVAMVGVTLARVARIGCKGYPSQCKPCKQPLQPLQRMHAASLHQFPLKFTKIMHALVAIVACKCCIRWGNPCKGCLHRLQGLPQPMQPLQATLAALATDVCSPPGPGHPCMSRDTLARP